MRPSRRDLAKMGIAGMLLAGVGAAALALRETVYRKPRRELQALTSKEFSILAAVADRVAPANGDFPSAWDCEVPEKIDELLAVSHPSVAAEFAQALELIENAVAGWTTFSGSSPEAQDVLLEGWRTSGLTTRRIVYRGVVGLISATYYASPQIWGAVGYPGPPDFGNTR